MYNLNYQFFLTILFTPKIDMSNTKGIRSYPESDNLELECTPFSSDEFDFLSWIVKRNWGFFANKVRSFLHPPAVDLSGSFELTFQFPNITLTP